MIASVVVTLDCNDRLQSQCLAKIGSRSDMEIGPTNADSNRLPVIIESSDRKAIADATEWLKTLAGVLLVDVVFVHFEEQVGAEQT